MTHQEKQKNNKEIKSAESLFFSQKTDCFLYKFFGFFFAYEHT